MKLFNFGAWLQRKPASEAEQKDPTPFHAVEIRCTSESCEAAKNTVGQRFVSAEAPLLPLAQCDRLDHCECRYQHYDDRRRPTNRRTEIGSPSPEDTPAVDRRELRDRRADDTVEEDQPFSVSEDSYYEHVGNTFRNMALNDGESAGVDPYNSGSFDKSKKWKSNRSK